MTEGTDVSGGNLRCTLLRFVALLLLPPPRLVFLGRPVSFLEVLARVDGLREVVTSVDGPREVIA